MKQVSAKEVYNFWFKEGHEDYWFKQDDAFDKEIKTRFYDTWEKGRHGLLYAWRESFNGRLAEIIVLDQFSRNLQRGSALSYAQDNMALILAQHAIEQPDFKKQPLNQKSFTLLPFMHSESKEIQKITEVLYLGLESKLHQKVMYEHKEIIDRFGRYPHRNEVLGRVSTKEEIEFLNENDLGFTNV